MTLIVNFFGGPHVGKTTICAKTYSSLNSITKLRIEMALEYAKDQVWSGNFKSLDNQAHVFGEQLKRVLRVLNKVNVIVTDAPLLNSITYCKGTDINFEPLIVEVFNSMQNLNFLIKRTGNKEDYDNIGRYHNYEEAVELDTKILKILNNNNINYKVIDRGDIDIVVNEVKSLCKC